MKKRDFKPLKRKSGIKKPHKLLVIASEGKYPEENYFNVLKNIYKKPTVYLHFIERKNDRSAPKHIITLLDKFKRIYNYRKNLDEFWILFDTDRWTQRNISSIAKECKQKCYKMAVSNPCFEIWILLHIKDVTEYSEEIIGLLEKNKKVNSKNYIEAELSNLMNGYKKRNFDCNKIISNTEDAIKNAKKINTISSRWPNKIGTHVYRLIQEIISL